MRRTMQSLLLAAVPLYLNYQSVLLDSGGAPLPSGPHELTFRITDDQHRALYEEVQTVDANTGVVATLIGNGTTPGTSAPTAGLTPDLFVPGETRYLEVLLGGIAADDPLEIVSVPYALWSARVAAGGVDDKAIAPGTVGMPHFANGLIDDLATALLASTPFADFQKGLAAPGGAQQVGVNTTFLYSGATTVQGVLKDLDLAIKSREEKNVNKAGDTVTGAFVFKQGTQETAKIDAATGAITTKGSVVANGIISSGALSIDSGGADITGLLKVQGDIQVSGGITSALGYKVDPDLVITKSVETNKLTVQTTSKEPTFSVDSSGKVTTKGGLELDGGLTVKSGNLDVKNGNVIVSGSVDGVDVSVHAESTNAHGFTPEGPLPEGAPDLTGSLANLQIKPKVVGLNEVSDDITTKTNFHAMLKDPVINPADTLPPPSPKIVAWGTVDCTKIENSDNGTPCAKPTGYNIKEAFLMKDNEVNVYFDSSLGGTDYLVQGLPSSPIQYNAEKFNDHIFVSPGLILFSFFVIMNK